MLGLMRWRTRAVALFTMILACAVLLSGCVHLDRGMKLNGDGSGTYTLSLGFSEALTGLMGDRVATSMDELGGKVKQKGGDYRHFDQDGYSVWVFTTPFKNVSELNALLQQNPAASNATPGGGVSVPSQMQDSLSVTETPGFFVNSFHVTGHISMKSLSDTSSAGSGIDMSSYMKDARESVSITMPGWISSYGQGGAANGNTVTYTAHYGEEATIDVVGGGVNPTAIYIAAGTGLLVLLAIGRFIFWRRRQQRLARAGEPALVAVGGGSEASVSPRADGPGW